MNLKTRVKLKDGFQVRGRHALAPFVINLGTYY